MANLQIVDGASATRYLKETGAGTNGDPHVPSVIVDSGTVTAVTGITNALPSGTNLLGKVSIDQATANANEVVVKSGTVTAVGGGNSVTATLTVTNGVYTIADVAGGLITFAGAVRTNGGKSIVNSIKLCGISAIAYELWFFNADIATPAADNAAFALAAADALKFLGAIPIAAGDYFAAQTAFNNATVAGCGLQVEAGAATTSIYAYLKCKEVTSPGTTTIYLTVDFEYLD